MTDPDGNRFVDLGASFAAATIGHSHPAVVAAIRDQAGRAAHVSSAAVSEVRVAFEEALVGIAPAGLDRVLLGLSGSDANDTALKLARTVTGRHEVIAFSGGYFGRGSGVIGLERQGRGPGRGRSRRRRPLPALPVSVSLAARSGRGSRRGALALVRHAMEDPASGFGPVAAIVVEPVQGNGGVIVPPDGFLAGPARPVRSPRRRPRLRRDPGGLRADRPDLGGRPLGRRPGPDDGRQGHRWRAGAVGGRRRERGHAPLDAGHAHLDVHGQRGQPRRRRGRHRRLAR